MTTDSYVIRPLFFPGGDIGKLSVCGTVNDLVVSGAMPKHLSLGLILEEGLPLDSLEKIIMSIAAESERAGVSVVTGDTKVVEKNRCDGIYINTTGIGTILRPMAADAVQPGDAVIITGTIGDHGTAVALARDDFDIDTSVESDCASLKDLLTPLFEIEGLRWMRDPTRGGVATVLAELSGTAGLGIEIIEDRIPVREDVRFIQDMLGYDPLYLANEGKAVVISASDQSGRVLEILRKHPLGVDAAIIGKVTSRFRGARLKTKIGGERFIEILEEDMLPRIC
jgi:hydrogenase expression/formation protein HypE